MGDHDMGRFGLRAVMPLICLLAVGLSGCEYKKVKMQLPTFFSSGIEELHFWRLDKRRGRYTRSGFIRLSPVYGPPGRQGIRYTMVNPDGTIGLTLDTNVKISGDSIVLELQYSRWGTPGWYRVSARNDAGESPLSGTEIYL